MEVTEFNETKFEIKPSILPLIQKKGAVYVKKGFKIIEN
jgi:hypothetical protein